jgi:hypothetical protein
MSLDYEFAPIDVSIMTHPKACAAGPEAMGLWLWGQAYAKLHRSDGRVHRAAALYAWGGKRNIMLAKRLVEAGLWLAREDGDWDIYNFDRKSPGRKTPSGAPPMTSTERVRKLRAEKKAQRPADVTDVTVTETACNGNGNAGTSTSTSYSVSSVSSGEGTGGGPPEWWAGSVAAAEQVVGSIDQPEARWVEYDASRDRKRWARNHRDAVGWLTSVKRSENERRVQSGGRIRAGAIVQSDENRAWTPPKEMA